MKTLIYLLLSLFFAAGVLFTLNTIQSDNLSDLSKQNIEAMAQNLPGNGTIVSDPESFFCYRTVSSVWKSLEDEGRICLFCNIGTSCTVVFVYLREDSSECYSLIL